MPTTPYIEKHFTATETVRDIVIGVADRLTVPFALAAGLAAAVSSTAVIVTAGLAEIVAGAIAMGLGAIWPRAPMPNIMLLGVLAKTGKSTICTREGRGGRRDPPRLRPARRAARFSRGGHHRRSATLAQLHDAL